MFAVFLNVYKTLATIVINSYYNIWAHSMKYYAITIPNKWNLAANMW